MKLQIEVEIDWIEKGGTLDEQIKSKLLQSIENKVLDSVAKKLTEVAEAKLLPKIDSEIDSVMADMIKGWVKKEVTTTDKWGNEKESGSIESILERRFHDFWQEKVNEKGQTGTYGASQTRMEWISKGILTNHCEIFANNMSKDVEKQVKIILEDRLKASLGGALIDNLGLPEIMDRIANKGKK